MNSLLHLFESESVYSWAIRLTLLLGVLRLGWFLTLRIRPQYRLHYYKTTLFSVALFLPYFIAGIATAPVSPTSEKFVERFSSLETSENVPPSIQWFPRWFEEEEWVQASPENMVSSVALSLCLLGALAFVFLWVRDQILLNRILLEARPAEDRLVRIVEEIAGELSLKRSAEVWVMPKRMSPFACGWIRKKIVLDKVSVDELEDDELRMVLAHELAHIRSNDIGWQQVAGFVSAVLWFHPMAWGLRRQYMELTERLSDEAAVFVSNEGSAYARLLAKIALMFNGCKTLDTVSAFRGVCSVRQRIADLTASSDNPLSISRRFRAGLWLSTIAVGALFACIPIMLEASSESDDKAVVERANWELSDPSWKTREQTALQLAKLERLSSQVLNPLIQCLTDDEWMVRKAAAMAIAKMGPIGYAAHGELIRLLGDEEWQARQAAAFALAAIGPSLEAIPALETALGDEEWHVRKPAAIALGSIGESARLALPNLITAIGDQEWHVRKAAIEAAVRIEPHSNEMRSILIDALLDEEGPVRIAAGRMLLRSVGVSPQSQSRVMGQLMSEDPNELVCGRNAIVEIASK